MAPYVRTSVKKDLISPPWTSTLGLETTAEGNNSWPLQTSLLELQVTVIFTLGLNESMTSPITLPTVSGSDDSLAMPGGGECGRQQLWVIRECFGKEMTPLFIVLKGGSHLSLPVISSAGGDTPSWVPSMDAATAHISAQMQTCTPFSLKAKRWEGEREDGDALTSPSFISIGGSCRNWLYSLQE
ncbi:hypothetical protein GW17_00008007 [Ensete ventricosum]|nr:hypothetical protein GW17_00008007 [Ensete ventricosum]